MDEALKAAREAVVREHMALENTGEFEAVLATFDHPRYELFGTGAVFDGAEAVMGYFTRSRTPFPDQRNELIELHSSEHAVTVEFWLMGTHLGPLRVRGETVAATGRTFRLRMAAVFEFAPGRDRIVCERPYFDQAALLAQLGFG